MFSPPPLVIIIFAVRKAVSRSAAHPAELPYRVLLEVAFWELSGSDPGGQVLASASHRAPASLQQPSRTSLSRGGVAAPGGDRCPPAVPAGPPQTPGSSPRPSPEVPPRGSVPALPPAAGSGAAPSLGSLGCLGGRGLTSPDGDRGRPGAAPAPPGMRTAQDKGEKGAEQPAVPLSKTQGRRGGDAKATSLPLQLLQDPGDEEGSPGRTRHGGCGLLRHLPPLAGGRFLPRSPPAHCTHARSHRLPRRCEAAAAKTHQRADPHPRRAKRRGCPAPAGGRGRGGRRARRHPHPSGAGQGPARRRAPRGEGGAGKGRASRRQGEGESPAPAAGGGGRRDRVGGMVRKSRDKKRSAGEK